MRNRNNVLKGFVQSFNRLILSLRESPQVGRYVQRHLTIVTYTGRRSGKTFSTPVGFQRAGDTVTIGVAIPDLKNWWRNFLDHPQPLSLELDGAQRSGQATSRRDDKGRVKVTVVLDQA